MKKIALFALALTMGMSAFAQDIITLPEVKKDVPTTLFEALQARHSVRSFQDTPIATATLAQLLWAATGVNREDGRMTAPTAVNAQELSVYVATKDGVCLYLPKENALKIVVKQDIRKEIADRQAGMANAPLFLIIVANTDKMKEKVGDRGTIMIAEDAGYVSQNICLASAALGLATVPRHGMHREAIKEILGLNDSYELMLNHPVGYAKN